jgi:dolichyl-phosphate-mannose-protein mannosyltransferase
MITAASIATMAGYWFVGAVLYRALMVQFWNLDEASRGAPAISDRNLLLRSVLPAIAIVGTIGTYLALFRLFRADVLTALGAALLVWRRHDAMCVAKALATLAADIWGALRRGNLLALAAIATFGVLTYILVLFAHVPASNVDTWVFQLPLAQSMAANHGFIYPQMNHLFYSNNPLFFNLLFAQALLFVDHFVAANAMNVTIYLGFLICVASFTPGHKAFGLLLMLFFVATSSFFSVGATKPLTDVPRTCYSVLALLFAHRYLVHSRVHELATAGLLAGAAVAGKYTELITVALIGAALLPRLFKDKKAWRDAAIFGAMVFVVGSYWYMKNWVLLGNPVYPFVFGHPGLSDEWMVDYMREMTRAFDPADRIYVTDLLTLKGWRDFAFILYGWFFADRTPPKIAAALILIGLMTRGVRIGALVGWTAALFVIWYAAMFNSVRWAMPAYLLFLSTAIVASFFLLDLCIIGLQTRGAELSRWTELRPWLEARIGKPRQRAAVVLAAGLGAALLTIGVAARVILHGTTGILPSTIDRDLVRVAFGQSSIDDYLATRREGYTLYRYIATHDLRVVFQPFDNGAVDYAPAYNGGRDGKWILHYRVLPSDGQSIEQFLSEHGIRYFIYRPSLADVEIDRYGQSHVDRSNLIFAALLPRSHLLLTDSFGWSLYEIDSSTVESH